MLQAQQATSLENAPAAAQLDPPGSPTLRVSFRDGLLSIEARQGPWVKVLEEIRKKTGILFHYSVPLEGSVTVSFATLPVKQALERLFGPDTNFIFRYPEVTDRSVSSALSTDVWVLGKVRGAGSAAIPTTGGKLAGELAASENVEPGEMPETPDRGDEQVAALEDTQGEQEQIDVLVEMARAEDPQKRLQALLSLSDSGKVDEGPVRSALDAALTDPDANVRAYAVQALASRGGPEAMGHLWQALRDPDPSVRIMAVDSVVPQDEGLALLREALSDADEAVRSLVAFKLKQELKQGGPE